jgi:hypothetical protein
MSFLRPPSSIFAPPSVAYSLLHHPITTLISYLHYFLLYLRGPSYKPPKASNTRPAIRAVCISDTHTKIPSQPLPLGDLLIHSGDLTNLGTLAEIQRSIDWLKTLQKPWPGSSDGYRYIVVVCGNHDSYFDTRSRSNFDKAQKNRKLDWGKIIYLQHESVTLPFPGDRKLKIYGAPQIPKCGGKEFAFQYERGQDAWSNTIPDDIDVLVTHNPPKWHLDVPECGGLGDEFELQEVWRIKPTLQVFGHVHSGYGRENVWWDKAQKTFEGILELAYGSGKKPYSQPMFLELLNAQLYLKGITLLWYDCKGILWNRLWKGARQGGIMVNAALTYQTSNKLRNKPQLVVL